MVKYADFQYINWLLYFPWDLGKQYQGNWINCHHILGSALGDRLIEGAHPYPANPILDNIETSGICDRLNSLIIVTKNNFVTTNTI